ncbi:vacuolar protein sorting-associated protein 54 [Lutzomyia longipalpis]|uniref:vacuolar protein sorting-associated protein 54 n=1 Tax=Lutzomyia longipalpis TaxID=7200 RepID=UPI002483733A|nr:vacuolar protein sorting-associated protein 54 [Lutzomyia longipalpis]
MHSVAQNDMVKAPNMGDVKYECQTCTFCSRDFKSSSEFIQHLRDVHCTREGGSFVCRYGSNGVCASLPLDGVSDRDYESHVNRYHVNQVTRNPEQWTVFSAAQNLPAVLNDPNRSKQTTFFTRTWGDSFVDRSGAVSASNRLPDITWNHFQSYLVKIGKRYKRHTRFEKQHTAPLTSHIGNQQNGNDITGNYGLQDIPQIFMKPHLELSNPATFASVFPGVGDGGNATQSGRLLQEKLSHYLDIVEVQIARQVAQKSSAFFHAMTSQDTIMAQMREASTNVRQLRSKLRHIDEAQVREALRVAKLARTRTHYLVVLEKLHLMATVHQTQPMIQLLLGTQDYVAALDLIGTTQEIVAQELVGVHCFRHLPSQLMEMERLVDKMLTTDFEKYATADFNRPLTANEKVLDEDKLVCIISGLLRKKNFTFVGTYKEEAIVAIKAIVKQLVIEIIASADEEICLTGAGEEAQSLSLGEWIKFLETATGTLLMLLKRVKAVYSVMLQTADVSAGKVQEVTTTVMDSEVFLSLQDHKVVQQRLSDLLSGVCNYCHERCANLVSNESLERSSVTAEHIARLSAVVNDFIGGCEEICGSQSVALRVAVTNQGTRFANKFHAERKSKLALLLDSERWKQADVPGEFQRMVEHIGRREFEWTRQSDDGISSPPSAVLLVDGEPFTLVGAALLLVQIVSEYCRCAQQLPIISAQLSRSVVDLLRTFNSRCCQLVLGAGALHVAGLKTITSGNLALVSRALQLVLWLLPHVKSHFQCLESNGANLAGYETVEKDFVSHIKEIENKVLSIVCSLVTNQLSSWDARPPVPSQAFRNISRHFVKLHEAIAPILPDAQVHSIYRVVHRSFKDRLREQILKYNIINNGGPQHGVVTSELTFYLETLRTLKAMPLDELRDETLNDIWNK